ncbi:hypothetical protein MRX96_008235 [Rhipicephalus microplus]
MVYIRSSLHVVVKAGSGPASAEDDARLRAEAGRRRRADRFGLRIQAAIISACPVLSFAGAHAQVHAVSCTDATPDYSVTASPDSSCSRICCAVRTLITLPNPFRPDAHSQLPRAHLTDCIRQTAGSIFS